MKNITRQEYEKALNIVQEYRENEVKMEENSKLKLKETQQERINNCKEHYFYLTVNIVELDLVLFVD